MLILENLAKPQITFVQFILSFKKFLLCTISVHGNHGMVKVRDRLII